MLDINFILFVLSIFQVFFVIYPFGGYIHPDEHFQCAEVAAKDIFNFKTMITWEWDNLYPCRTILFPYIACGFPFFILKTAKNIFNVELSSELLVIAPRCFMYTMVKATEYFAVLTFQQDFQQTSSNGHVEDSIKMFKLLYRSSYVTLVLMCRPFSNTLECLLFVISLYFIEKLKSSCCTSKYNQCILKHVTCIAIYGLLGFLFGLGVFIRSSFPSFIVAPVCLFLLHSLIYSEHVSLNHLLIRLLILGVSCVLTMLSITLFDNLYFSTNNLQVTPFNLMRYNANLENLKQHGIHPRYLHFLVNMVLLFGPAHFLFIFVSFALLLLYLHDNSNYVRLFELRMSMYVIIPIMIISIVPHQEPRYILPVIVPLMLTIVRWLVNHQAKRGQFFVFWFIFNIICLLWFGVLHQGGVTPIISKINKRLVHSSVTSDINAELNQSISNLHDIVFFKTYMVPRHLFMINKSNTAVAIHDMSGCNVSKLNIFIKNLLPMKNTHKKILLVAPSPFHQEIVNMNEVTSIHLVDDSFPHVSAENLPTSKLVEMMAASHVYEWMGCLYQLFKLNLYEIL